MFKEQCGTGRIIVLRHGQLRFLLKSHAEFTFLNVFLVSSTIGASQSGRTVKGGFILPEQHSLVFKSLLYVLGKFPTLFLQLPQTEKGHYSDLEECCFKRQHVEQTTPIGLAILCLRPLSVQRYSQTCLLL